MVMQIFYFFGILLKCLIQGKRPNWLLNEADSENIDNKKKSCFINFKLKS